MASLPQIPTRRLPLSRVEAPDKGATEDGRAPPVTSPSTDDIQKINTGTLKDKEVCADATPSRKPVDQDEQRCATIRVRNGRLRSKGPLPLLVLRTTRNLPQLRLKPGGLPQILRRKLHHPHRRHKRRDRKVPSVDGRPRQGGSEQPTSVPLRHQQAPDVPRQATVCPRPTNRWNPKRPSKRPAGPSPYTKDVPYQHRSR